MFTEKWSITYTWHDKEEHWHTVTEVIEATTISEAIDNIDKFLSEGMELRGWSDYWITNVNILPELH